MAKQDLTFKWIWKWHIIGGLISLPIILLLSITGVIYLFKDSYEKPIFESVKTVDPNLGSAISFEDQWKIASEYTSPKNPETMIIPTESNQATEFTIGRFSHKNSYFVDPYQAKASGKIILQETDMHSVRKLHGELLMGSFGTKIVELVASWMVVLILTGLFIFWPRNGFSLKSLFTFRTKGSRRILFRDLHALSGFLSSGLLLLILAGGLPWTDIFGANFQFIQKYTNTGMPKDWEGRHLQVEKMGTRLTLDQMVNKAKSLNLPGEVSIKLPQSESSIFSVYNGTSNLEALSMVHFNLYTGQKIQTLTWKDMGILIRARLWVMAFHQGEFGLWNWYLVLLTALALVVLCVSALVSYLYRKQKGSWSIPVMPNQYKIGVTVTVLVVVLGIILPLFGASVIVIWVYERFVQNKKKTSIAHNHVSETRATNELIEN